MLILQDYNYAMSYGIIILDRCDETYNYIMIGLYFELHT